MRSTSARERYRKLLNLLEFESCIGVPVEAAGEVNHAIFLFDRAPNAFSPQCIGNVQATAEFCAAILERDLVDPRLRSLAGLLLSGQLAASLEHEIFNRISGLEIGLHNLKANCEKLALEIPALTAAPRYQGMHEIVEGLVQSHREMAATVTLFRRLMTTPESGSFDVNEVVRACETQMRPQARKQGVKIEFRLTEPLPLVATGAVRVMQVFLNVMLNALQHMVAQRQSLCTLTVTTQHEASSLGNSVVVRFSDTGPGIHQELWERIFDLGYTSRSDSSGLNLYIAAQSYAVHRRLYLC